jgi:glucan phosphorylase
MTAAMNGAVNFSTDDGWICEFIDHGNNGFVVPKADYANMTVHEQDEYDLNKAYEILEQQILPIYYEISIPGDRSKRTACAMCGSSSTVTGWRMSIMRSCIKPLIKLIQKGFI